MLTINATDVDGAEYGLTLSMVPAHTVYGWGARHVPAAFAYTSPIGGTATAHGIKTNGTMKDDGEWHGDGEWHSADGRSSYKGQWAHGSKQGEGEHYIHDCRCVFFYNFILT